MELVSVPTNRQMQGEAAAVTRQGLLDAARYFVRHELPAAEIDARLLTSFDDTCLSAQPRHF